MGPSHPKKIKSRSLLSPECFSGEQLPGWGQARGGQESLHTLGSAQLRRLARVSCSVGGIARFSCQLRNNNEIVMLSRCRNTKIIISVCGIWTWWSFSACGITRLSCILRNNNEIVMFSLRNNETLILVCGILTRFLCSISRIIDRIFSHQNYLECQV